LAGLWQLPAVERERRGAAPSDEDLVRWAAQAFARLGTREFHVVTRIRHEFTHRVWEVAVVRPVGGVPQTVREANPAETFGGPYADAAWTAQEELSRFTLPRVYEKLLGAMMGV
jgi:adenine-specific DNA glycosylase